MTAAITYAEHTPYSDPGRHAEPFSPLPTDPESLSAAARNVIVHYRDHTLLYFGALRSHGIPARSRVGFAGYFDNAWPLDSTGFVTAAQAWVGSVEATSTPTPTASTPTLTASTPDVPIHRRERFLFDEVIHEVAHRFGNGLHPRSRVTQASPYGDPPIEVSLER